MDQIFIRDLRIQAILGVSAREREHPQEIVINIVLHTDTHLAAKSDDISDCVNYETVAQEICILVEHVKRQTVEALAEEVAQMCLRDTRIHKVRVRVEKPEAVPGTTSVGVEIEREK